MIPVRMKTSNQRRKALPQHRQAKRRSLLQKLRIVSVVLASLCSLIAIALGAVWVLRGHQYTPLLGRLALAYLGAGVFFLLLRVLIAKKRMSWRRRMAVAPPSMQSGMTLILVLVLIGLVTALVLHTQYAASLARKRAEHAWAANRMQHALADEVFSALRRLADDKDLRVDHAEESWAEDMDIERPDGIGVYIRMEDLNRRFDWNNIRPGDGFAYPDHGARIIMDLMTLCGDFDPIERADALLDWVDENEEGRRENDFYQRFDPAYKTPGTWLQSWGELLDIAGFSLPYFERLSENAATGFAATDTHWDELFALIPGARAGVTPVNINTASQKVLEGVLGMERESLIRYILLTRAERPFRALDGLLAAADPSLLRDFEPYLDVRSAYFEVYARASDNMRRTYMLKVWVHRDDQGAVKILRWMPLKEGQA